MAVLVADAGVPSETELRYSLQFDRLVPVASNVLNSRGELGETEVMVGLVPITPQARVRNSKKFLIINTTILLIYLFWHHLYG